MSSDKLFSVIHWHDIAGTTNRSLAEMGKYSKKKKFSEFKDGEFNKTDPIDWGSELLCIFLLFLFPGCLLWVWVPIIWIFYNFFVNRSIWDFLLVIGLAVLSFGPVKYRWKEAIHSRITDTFGNYFSFKMIYEEMLPDDQAYILVAPPHGVFPFGNLLTLAVWDSHADFHFSGAGASILYYIPIMRHVMTWIGCIDAGIGPLKKELLAGRSIGLSSGGIAELFESNEDRETIVIKNRKGFVKLAMTTNAKLVPCYLFGNTQALHCLSDSNRLMSTFSRKLKASITLFWGRFGLPIAYRTPILAAMGKPIAVPQYSDPSKITKEEIDRVHGEFVQALEELFDTHKRAYGWAHKKLNIK